MNRQQKIAALVVAGVLVTVTVVLLAVLLPTGPRRVPIPPDVAAWLDGTTWNEGSGTLRFTTEGAAVGSLSVKWAEDDFPDHATGVVWYTPDQHLLFLWTGLPPVTTSHPVTATTTVIYDGARGVITLV